MLDNGRVVDREIRHALIEVVDRIASCAHHLFDELIRVGHGGRRVVDELRLDAAP